MRIVETLPVRVREIENIWKHTLDWGSSFFARPTSTHGRATKGSSAATWRCRSDATSCDGGASA